MEITEKHLEYHIDDPIKKCVVGMALLGFTPLMSCCGFEYKGEKVKKTHLLDKPYIYLDVDKVFESSGMCRNLLNLAKSANWKLNFSSPSAYFIDFHGLGWENNHPWKTEGCPHRHEMPNISISQLEKAIEVWKDHFLPKVEIIDGNKKYTELFKLKYWQYEPTESWIVTPETFFNL